MLYHGLEKAIQKGLAQYKTFVHAVGGIGRIPCPKGSFIIITGFDYFHFVDPIGSGAEPAVMSFSFTGDEGGGNDLTFQISGLPLGPTVVTFANADPSGSLVDFQLMLDSSFPGFTASGVFNPITKLWIIQVTTTTPGTAWNGITPDIILDPVAPDLTVDPFADGADAVITKQSVIDASTHQLEFRSNTSRNNFVIREDVAFFLGVGGALSYNVRGHFHRDVYLVHTESIKINIAKIPPPESWTSINYSAVDPKAQEDKSPVGYGTGAGGFNTIRQVEMAPGENYLPLQNEFEDLVQTGSPYFRPDIISGRELADPTANIFAGSNGRNYPIVNIEYVLIKRTASDFVLPS